MNTDDTIRHNLLVNVARLHYLQKLTHAQIAEKLKLSRVKVTRLLQKAVEERIVEFRIADPAVGALELQDRLEKLFALKVAIVTPAGRNDEDTIGILGRHAARFLQANLSASCTVGLGWGRTLNAMVDHLAPARRTRVKVVSLTGGLAANANQPNPYDTTTAVASRLGATPHYLLLPAIVDSPQAKRVLLKEAGARRIMRHWERLELCMMSIGALSARTGIFYSFEDPVAEVRKTKSLGGVGDLLARPFDIDGRLLPADYVERTITIGFELLKKVPLVAGVAGGANKIESILGALRTGYLNALLTDERSAQKVLALAGDGAS